MRDIIKYIDSIRTDIMKNLPKTSSSIMLDEHVTTTQGDLRRLVERIYAITEKSYDKPKRKIFSNLYSKTYQILSTYPKGIESTVFCVLITRHHFYVKLPPKPFSINAIPLTRSLKAVLFIRSTQGITPRENEAQVFIMRARKIVAAGQFDAKFNIVWSNKLILEQNEFATIDKPIDAEQFTPIILSKCILNSLGVHDEEQV